MAIGESIREGIDALNAALYEAQSFVEMCDELGGDEASTRPAWIDCIGGYVGRMTAASEALERVLRTQVIPHLEGQS